MLHSSQRRPTQVNEGPQQPTMANEGQRRPTKAHSSHWVANDGQQRPTKAHADEKGPKRRVWRRLGHRCVILGENPYPYPSKPVPLNAVFWGTGTGFPPKSHIYGPNDASGIVWALFRLCGPLLAVVGCCGPSWARIGLR